MPEPPACPCDCGAKPWELHEDSCPGCNCGSKGELVAAHVPDPSPQEAGAPRRPVNVDCHACGEKLGCVICGEDADPSAHETDVRRKVADGLRAEADREQGAGWPNAAARVRALADRVERGEL